MSGGGGGDEKAAKPETTAPDSVSTCVSTKPLDIFNETMELS